MGIGQLRVAFIGMSRFFTRPVLRAVAARCSLVAIVEAAPTSYSLSDGAENPWSSHLQTYARHRGLPYFLLHQKGTRAGDFLRQNRPDVVCVACSEQLLRKEEFEVAPLGTINLHPSLLPKFRGPDPYFWQSYEMDLDGGVTIHYINEGIDTGDILLQEHFPIALGDSFLQIFQRSLGVGSEAMIRTLELLAAGEAKSRPQKHLPCPRYARIVAPGEQLVDWQTWPIQRVWHFLRATHDQHPFLPVAAGCRWSIGSISSQRPSIASGNIARDRDGHFVAHREGKIRLKLHRQPHIARRLLLPIAQRARRAIEWW